MQNAQTIFVTGATGNQGQAVVQSLLKKGFKIKALTRNSLSSAAQNLQKQSVEIVQGDLNNPDSFTKHLKQIDGLFCLLTYENGIENEIQQGIDLANYAKIYGVKHFLYSSVIYADLHSGVLHWESKRIIEDHIKQIALPYSIIRPASLYENFLIPQVKSRIAKGKLVSPVNKNVLQQFISCRDIGELSADIFMNRERYLGKTIPFAAEEMDMLHVAKIFSAVLEREIAYQKLPLIIARLAMGKMLHKMFKWINKNDSVLLENMNSDKYKVPQLLPLSEWIKMHFDTKL